MDLNLLKTFVVVAKTRNISQAAAELNLSQPAVSLQIKQLEERLGQALFLRHPLRITDTGQHFLVNAQAILSQWDATLTFINAEKELTQGSLTIACSDTVMRYCLLPSIKQFRVKHPGITLSFLNRTSFGSQEAVLNGEADLAIGLLHKEHSKLIHKKLFSYQEVAVAPRDHAWNELAHVTAHKLVKENLLLLEERTQTRQMLDQWLQTKQVRLRESMSLGSVEAQIELARISLGVAVVPEFACPKLMSTIPIKGLPKRQIVCFYQRLKPAAQAWLRLDAATSHITV